MGSEGRRRVWGSRQERKERSRVFCSPGPDCSRTTGPSSSMQYDGRQGETSDRCSCCCSPGLHLSPVRSRSMRGVSEQLILSPTHTLCGSLAKPGERDQQITQTRTRVLCVCLTSNLTVEGRLHDRQQAGSRQERGEKGAHDSTHHRYTRMTTAEHGEKDTMCLP